MPELPDVDVYVDAIGERVIGRTLDRVRIRSSFVLRTVEPPVSAVDKHNIIDVKRLGKRVVLEFENGIYIVVHLMIAGRLWWRKPGVAVPKGKGLAAFDFEEGSLLMTEVSNKKRASIHVVEGKHALAEFDRGGVEVLEAEESRFADALTRDNHTLKRALTDPRVLSGIGNAYSDEILFAAGLSPFKQTRNLTAEELTRLFQASVTTLSTWKQKLQRNLQGKFPEKVTAFHPDMAVHGKYREPCPVCNAPVQRIVYAENESNYCARCQTGGRLLADRALSRLLKQNWPRTLDELENC